MFFQGAGELVDDVSIDYYAEAFAPLAGRCFRLVSRVDRQAGPDHCPKPPTWRGRFRAKDGRWYIVGVFGLPLLHEDDALRAVRAAAEMRDEVASLNEWLQRDWGVPIAVRTGINTGTIIVGASSVGKAFITHEAVSLAVRLGQAAHPGEILLGESTYRLVRAAVTVEPVAALVVEGRQEPVQAVRLTSTAPDLVSQSRLSSAMVGRDRDQNLLHEAFERVVRDRNCHLFTILGGAGVGKSRLVAEFASAVRERATILSGRCLPYGDGITLWPLIEVIRQAARIAEDVPTEVVKDKLAEAMAGQEHGGHIARRVAALLGIGDPAGSPEEQFWAVRKLAETVARRRPLVVHFDDLHWAEPTFLDLVEHVAEWSRDAPLLIVCSARPDLLDQRPNWGEGKLNTTTIMLEPLTEAESLRVIANLLGGTPPAGTDWAGVNQAAEGNPLFLEELVAMLIDDGILRRQDDRWVPIADLSGIAVPPTINALLSARLEQLEPGTGWWWSERRWSARSSTWGRWSCSPNATARSSAPTSGRCCATISSGRPAPTWRTRSRSGSATS
jgi:AAA ATPase-like protein